MKVGDLVKVRRLSTSDYGIIIGTYIRGNGKVQYKYWNVYFLSLEYEVPFLERELEIINESR